MLIKNANQLLSKDLNEDSLNLRKLGLKCIERAIQAVKPANILQNTVKIEGSLLTINGDVFNLNQYGKVYLIGGGKATAEMTFSLVKILESVPDLKFKGIINIQEGLELTENLTTSRIKVNLASHPLPNEIGLNGTREMIKLIKNATENDLIICLISGGGSALLPFPKEGISLEDLQDTNRLLLSSGASIQEINTIRKHLSNFKGGNLAKIVYNSSNSTLITLIISDVIGNDLDIIASGPTVPDSSTFKDALNVLESHEIIESVPKAVRKIIDDGLNNEELENPKEADVYFSRVHNFLIGSVDLAVDDLISFLHEKNFQVECFTNQMTGEARNYGAELIKLIDKRIENMKTWYRLALIGTGELTVTIKGSGIGGRNQEMLLSLLSEIKDKKLNHEFLIISLNLDGIEGNSKAMGALIDNSSINKIETYDITLKNYLDNNDSNTFFKKMESEIITGQTGCNVNDLTIILLMGT